MQIKILKFTLNFNSIYVSTPLPTPKLEDHPLSAVRDCLFNIFAAALHPQPEDAPYRGD
jgi:hypothetical protein